MGAASQVMIQIGANAAQAVNEFQKLDRAVGDSMTKTQKAQAAVKRAAVPAAIALTAVAAGAIDAAKAAAEDAAAASKLAGQLKRVTGASDDAVKSAEDYISSLSQQVGIADDELRPALGQLATATGDLSKAQDALKVALDVSAQTGRPLEQVSKALSRAYSGQGGALSKLIPGLDKATLKSGDFAKINEALAKVTGGAATEAANTAEGQFRRFGIAMQETKESIGAALMPAIEAVLPILQRFGKWVQDHTDIVKVLAVGIAGIAGAILAVNAGMKVANTISTIWSVATKAAAAAQWLLNAAMAANPIGLIAVAIAGLVTGIVLLYTKSETFRNVLDGIWQVMKDVGSVIWDTLKPGFDVIVGVVKTVAALFSGDFSAAWEGLKGILSSLGEFALNTFLAIPGMIVKAIPEVASKALELGKALLSKLGEGVGDLGKWIGSKVLDIASGVASLPGRVADALTSIGGKVLHWFTEGVGSLAGAVWDKVTAIAGVLAGLPGTVVDALSGLGGKVLYWFVNGIGSIAGAVWDKITDIASAASGLPDAVVGWLQGIGGKFVHWIVDGIAGLPMAMWNAFTGGLQWLIQKIQKWIFDHYPDIPGLPGPPKSWGKDPGPWSGSGGGTQAQMTYTTSFAARPIAVAASTSMQSALDEEVVARAIQQLILRSDARNGRTILFA